MRQEKENLDDNEMFDHSHDYDIDKYLNCERIQHN
jgi:hypothetical protein